MTPRDFARNPIGETVVWAWVTPWEFAARCLVQVAKIRGRRIDRMAARWDR